MAYLRFLLEWYNLPWLLAVGAGLLVMAERRRRRRAAASGFRSATSGPSVSPSVLLVAAGIAGLTLNGALHDFRLDPVGRWFPLVAVLSLTAGWLIAWGGSRLRHRWFPHVGAVAFNQPGLEGEEAVVLSADLGPDRIGRARHRDEAGVSNIVRVHVVEGAEPGRFRFGQRVRLGTFDPERRSYPIAPL